MVFVNRWVLTLVILTTLSAPIAAVLAQQPDGAVALTVQLRAADGAAIVGETVSLQRLPESTDIAPLCKTNEQGICTWYVGRGLYQVLFEKPLDEVSALALAEGGLRGFGLTVGAENIVYHFTFHRDGRVYFDAAPDAATPVPIIPTAERLHGGAHATATPQATVSPTATANPELLSADNAEAEELTVMPPSESEGPPPMEGSWRLLILATTGLMAGSGLHWWTRRHSQKERSKGHNATPSQDGAVIEEQDHA